MAFAIFLQLAYLLPSLASKIVLRLSQSHLSPIHLALFLSTFCLITMSFVFTSDNCPVCLFATAETDWLSSTFSASVVEISSVLLATVCSQTRIVHEICWAGSHMSTGLTAVRDLQLGGCCQREMLWCGSPHWIVHWFSRHVL